MAVPLQDDGNGGEMEFEQGALDDPPDEGTLPYAGVSTCMHAMQWLVC